MDIFQTVILALVQGVSEFLPISSSAHLILIPKIMNLPDQGLAFDVVLHLGTLSAIVFYYRLSIWEILSAFFKYTPNANENAKMGWGVILATIPVGLIGLFFKEYIEQNMRTTEVIAYATLGFGVLLGLADYWNNKQNASKHTLSWFAIGFIGLMQSFALIPGASRSGVVITAGLLIGLSRTLAVKFGFLLSIPVIVLSSGLIALDLYHSPQSVDWLVLFIGFVLSGLSAYFVVFLLIKIIEKIGMSIFVIYRIILGLGLLMLPILGQTT
jgi:undecaprenyl-diphosphatase